MKPFTLLCRSIFADMGEIDFDRLNPVDRRRLCAAYVRGNPECVETLLCAIRPESIAEEISALISHPDRDQAVSECDVFDLAQTIRDAAYPNAALLLDVEAEYAHEWRQWRKEMPALAQKQAS